MSVEARAFFLDAVREPLVERALDLGEPALGEVIVEVLACGLCHTDLGFADGSVPPKHPLPLVLGHEAVGKVVAAGPGDGIGAEAWLGKTVIVPAVLPCGACDLCATGRGNACTAQKMPGNDIHGGFATHMRVPAGPLVDVSDAPAGFDVRLLSVVADAVSTAWQAVIRSELRAGDVAFVIGVGGVGGFVAQIAHALGARVVAMDVSAARLEGMAEFGADLGILVGDAHPKEVRREAHGFARSQGIGSGRFRIFECSGTTAGQQLAWTMLSRAATMVQVGYTPKPVELRFSNLMAFDATVHGTWGCPPEAYGDVLRLIYAGQVALEPFCAFASMKDVNVLLADMAAHKLDKRMVMTP